MHLQAANKKSIVSAPSRQASIQDCMDLIQACSQMLNYCLEKDRKYGEAQSLKLLTCAEICRKCARSCEEMANPDHLREFQNNSIVVN